MHDHIIHDVGMRSFDFNIVPISYFTRIKYRLCDERSCTAMGTQFVADNKRLCRPPDSFSIHATQDFMIRCTLNRLQNPVLCVVEIGHGRFFCVVKQGSYPAFCSVEVVYCVSVFDVLNGNIAARRLYKRAFCEAASPALGQPAAVFFALFYNVVIVDEIVRHFCFFDDGDFAFDFLFIKRVKRGVDLGFVLIVALPYEPFVLCVFLLLRPIRMERWHFDFFVKDLGLVFLHVEECVCIGNRVDDLGMGKDILGGEPFVGFFAGGII